MKIEHTLDIATEHGWEVEQKERIRTHNDHDGLTTLVVVFRRGFRVIDALWVKNPRTGRWNFQYAKSEDNGYYAGIHDLREHLQLPTGSLSN